MSYRALLLVAMFFIFVNSLCSQNEPDATTFSVLNKYQFQEEVYSFPKPVRSGVGTGGELNLQIPIMTIPGRAGLSFNIAYSYQSGIKVDQEASWVGLGWSFNPGSITRDIRGNLKDIGCDYTSASNDMPDQYYVTIPGHGTVQMFRGAKIIPGTTILQPQDKSATQFQLKEYRPYKIEFQTISQLLNGSFSLDAEQRNHYQGIKSTLEKDSFAMNDDIGRFIITTDDGTRYIYEYPSLASYTDMSNLADPNRAIAYVSAWRLAAILSPGIPTEAKLDPQELEKYHGSWILFKYDFYPVSVNEQMEYFYLSQIITPTHVAKFVHSKREDWTGLFSYWDFGGKRKNRNIHKLTSIKLFVRTSKYNWSSLQTVRSVGMRYDYHLAESYLQTSYKGKLTLIGIDFYDYNGQIGQPGYGFKYEYNPDVITKTAHYDAFGYYSSTLPWGKGNLKDKNNTDYYECSAWSLTRIVNPMGGVEEIEYKPGHIDNRNILYTLYSPAFKASQRFNEVFYLDPNENQNTADMRNSGGPRVATIKRSKPSKSKWITEFYTYGPGYIPGLPPRVIPHIPNVSSHETEFYNRARGKLGITYSTVNKTIYDEDTGVILMEENHYSVADGVFSTVEYMKNLLYLPGGGHCVYINSDPSPQWGKLIYQRISSGSNGGVNKTDISENNYAWYKKEILNDFSVKIGTVTNTLNIAQYCPRVVETKSSSNLGSDHWNEIKQKFVFDPLTMQTIRDSTFVDGTLRVNFTEYARQSYSSSSNILEFNQYNLVTRKWEKYFPSDRNKKSSKISRASIFTYKKYAYSEPGLGTFGAWKQDREYVLEEEDFPTQLPSFSSFTSTTDPPHWHRTKTLTYNSKLLPTKISYPGGASVILYYGSDSSPLSYTSSIYAGSKLTGVKYIKGSEYLTRKVIYDHRFFKPSKVYDENNQYKKYNYDKSGRLSSVVNENGKVVASYSVNYARFSSGSDSTYMNAKPNTLLQKKYYSDSNYLQGYSYFDDWANGIQNVESDGISFRYQSSILDFWGRPYKNINKYIKNDIHGAYDVDFEMRKPDGSLVDLTNQTLNKEIMAGVVKNSDNPLFPSRVDKQISFDAKTTKDEMVWRLGATFFDLPGKVNLQILFSDGRKIQKSIEVTLQEVLNGFLVNKFVNIEFFRENASFAKIHIDVEVSENSPHYQEKGKKYVMTVLSMDIPNENKEKSNYSTWFSYLGAGKDVTEIQYPGDRLNPPVISKTYRYVAAKDVGISTTYTAPNDTTFLAVEDKKLLRVEAKAGIQTDFFVYKPFIDHRGSVLCKVSAYPYGSSPASASYSISSTDPDFQIINKTISSGTSNKIYTIDFKAGHDYRFNVSAEALWGMGLFNSSIEVDILKKDIQIKDQSKYYRQLKEVLSIDELGNKTASYSNSLGQQVLEIRYDGSSPRKTQFEYDAAGNLISVYPPNYFSPPYGSRKDDWEITYRYNTLGQLVEKHSPDAGLERFRYDQNGNLVFSQNASEKLYGQFRFTTFDYANRPLKIGLASGDFDNLSESYTPPENAVNTKYHYDKAVNFALFLNKPAVKNNIGTFAFAYPKGKLVMSEFKSGGKWQYELFSYKREGSLGIKKIVTEDPTGVSGTASNVLLTYENNFQGMLTKRTANFGGKNFYHFYQYDRFGNLTGIKASAINNINQAVIAKHDYDQNDLITQTRYTQNGPDLIIDKSYNLRNWLRRIDAASNDKKFWADYSFLDNGNIESYSYFNIPVSGSEKIGKYSFTYDGLNQLKSAIFSSYNGSAWTNDYRYRVDNLKYDANGNILYLNRYDNARRKVDQLTYRYSHNNRLLCVDDGVSAFYGWDAQDSDFHYDHDGNVTNIVNNQSQKVTYLQNNQLNLPEAVETAPTGETVKLMTRARSKTGSGFFQYQLANGTYKSLSGRGFWVVQLKADGKTIISSRRFDMYYDGKSSSQGTEFATYLNTIPRDNRIVLIGVYYSGTNYNGAEWTESAYTAMEKLGATEIRKLKIFDNYAFAVVAGRPYTATEQLEKAYYYESAPYKCSLSIPINRTTAVTYRYNIHGQRFYKKFANGNVEHYIMDGDLCLGVSDKVGNMTYWNIVGNGVEGRYEAGKYYFYVKDHLGSTRMVMRNDNTIVEANDYYPFGLKMPGRSFLSNSHPSKEAFTGKEEDKETKLTYFGARYYSPAIGRWMSADPLDFKYSSHSPYNYCLNNPIKYIDIFGMNPWSFAAEYGTTGDGLTDHLSGIESDVDQIHNNVAGRDAIVTFTTNGTHSAGSFHYEGNAIDLRTKDLTTSQINEIVEDLVEKLGDEYDIVNEGDHIHIEYDPPNPPDQINQESQINNQEA